MTATPIRAVRRLVRPQPVLYCNAGVTPCGAKGRLYACGVRCGLHSPCKEIRKAAEATLQVRPGTDVGPGCEVAA